MVYILNLLSADPPTDMILYDHDLALALGAPEDSHDAHDVAVSPDGTLAVVTANFLMGLYDLRNGVFLGGFHQPIQWRFYGQQADSIEIVGDKAVALSWRRWGSVSPPFPNEHWEVEVFRINLASPTLVKYQDWLGASFPNAFNHDPPHDLAVASVPLETPKKRAVVKTGSNDVVLLDLDQQTSSLSEVLVFSQGSSLPLGSPFADYPGTWVSDSVLVTPPFTEVLAGPTTYLRHYAVAIGGTPGTGPTRGRIDFIDLAKTPPELVSVLDIDGGTDKVMPADLQVAGQGVLVRCTAPPDEPPVPPNNTGRDVFRFSLTPPQEVGRIGGRGRVFAIDSLEVVRTAGVSVAESVLSPFNGFVHTVQVLD
jgi:hypothetical protein